MEVFDVPPAERNKRYASVGVQWRDCEARYKLSVSTPPNKSYYTGVVLKEGSPETLALFISDTKFLVPTFLCSNRSAWSGLLETLWLVRMQVLWPGLGTLTSRPVKTWKVA